MHAYRIALAMCGCMILWFLTTLIMLGILEAGYTISTRNLSGFVCIRGKDGAHNFMAFSWPEPLSATR